MNAFKSRITCPSNTTIGVNFGKIRKKKKVLNVSNTMTAIMFALLQMCCGPLKN